MDWHPWQPMQDKKDLKHLGKLGEESGELNSAVSRCIIQGINEQHPITGKYNIHWLEDEIADVIATAELTMSHFHLNIDRIEKRIAEKKEYLKQWHNVE